MTAEKTTKSSSELSTDIGRWRTARATPKQDQYKDLDALGYMDGYEDAPDFSGVVRYKKEQVFDGYISIFQDMVHTQL